MMLCTCQVLTESLLSTRQRVTRSGAIRSRGGAVSRRGVAYWDGEGRMPARLFFTSGTRLFAIDAENRSIRYQLRQGGEVDMGVPYNSVPLVYGNVVVVGANTPRGTIGGIGNARAFDVRTGEQLWEFSSVAQPGEGSRYMGGRQLAGAPRCQRLAVLLHDGCRARISLPTAGFAHPWLLRGRSTGCQFVRQCGPLRWISKRVNIDGTSKLSITTSGMLIPPAPPVLFDNHAGR